MESRERATTPQLNRREFLYTTATAVGATFALQSLAQEAAAPPFSAGMPREIGRTGLTCSLLGMGTGTKASGGSSGQNRQGREAFLKCLEHAYGQGLTYFDMADSYGAHDYMREAMKRSIPRDKVMLLTKTGSRDADGLRADIDRFRKELDVDALDIVLMHCMMEDDWTTKFRPAVDALLEAKAQGKVKAIGCSNHTLPALKQAATADWVDVILARVNPKGVKMDASPEEVVPVLKQAHDSGKGIIGMKIAGEGELASNLTESLQYVLNLGFIDAITIGFIKPEEVNDTVSRIQTVTKA